MTKPEEENRREASKKLSRIGKRFFELIEFDEDEQLILEIRKHPFGMFLVVFTGLVVTIFVVAITAFILAGIQNGFFDDIGNVEQWRGLIFVIGAALVVGSIGLTVMGTIIYESNVIFVTSEKIAQVLYKNIIDRKISQLNIGDIQDVTISQNGLFARLFGYGVLVIETAGEQQNYTFTYVPKPYETGREIIGAHERNVSAYGN